MTGTSAGTLEEKQPASALEESEEVQSFAAEGAENAALRAAGAGAGAESAGAGAAIKECPICKTTLFGDMDTCYGCMYRFGSSPDLEAPEQTHSSAQAAALSKVSANNDYLFNKFLVEFHSFLGDFIADRKINVD